MRVHRIPQKQATLGEKTKPVDLSLIDHVIEKYKSKKGSLIPILQETQEIFRYIPQEAFEKIAAATGLKTSDMYGVATFYSQFRLKPVGKHIIKVCHGTACHVQNAESISEAVRDHLQAAEGETTADGLFTIESVACLGCCALAPVMMIGDETYGKLNDKKTVSVLKDIKQNEK